MARSRETKIELTAYDDLFQTDESREEAKLSKIRDIPISEIDEFPDHPFKVLMDEDMEQLVESIKRNGVMTPATVRLKEDGRYELISGHRRKKACELAGLETLKCEVKELTRDEAIIVMVESNLQRSVILPSEKAFAYKMRLEAMNRQGQRTDLTSVPLAQKSEKKTSREKLGEIVGESQDQIRRFIRLTELVPEILQMVDEKQIAFRPAVEISYLSEEQQYTLLEAMSYNDATPSLAQAINVTFSNTLKRGALEIIKNSEDNLVEGVKFHLYGTSLSGLPVDEYAVTDASGVARFENVLISGSTPYTVEEIDTATRYVTKRKDTVIDFEQLGVDRLFIDESHFYKNLYLYTKMRNVGGIAQTEAQKSSDLFMKCRYLDEITGNRGTVFATGTPVSNLMVELYSVQRYLQYDTLVQNGLQHFDSWASTFGETITALELAPEGSSYRPKTRFAKFHNLPELMQMFREVADIQTADMLKLPVPKVNYRNIKVAPSEIQTEMVASLAKRAEKVRDRLVEPYIDNMLKITNDGRKLALDQRLIDPMLPDFENSKVNACVDNVYRIWAENADTRATQLVFCDLSTPKNDGTFNVYDDIRTKLTDRGIPAEQIRFIHEATTDAQKKELFAKVRSGEVRVLLGSTPKMGAGTNVQDRLKAIS